MAKKATKKITKKPTKKTVAEKTAKKASSGAARTSAPATPKLLAGGNPQIPKGDGDAPVQAYLDAIPGWKQDLARRLDSLIDETVPGVRKAIRWNSPFYGTEGRGWFLSVHCFTNYVKVGFHNGASLRPPPPVESKHGDMRYLHLHEGDKLDAQLTRWIRQSSKLPGEGMG